MRLNLIAALTAGALALAGCAALQDTARDAGVPEPIVQGGTEFACLLLDSQVPDRITDPAVRSIVLQIGKAECDKRERLALSGGAFMQEVELAEAEIVSCARTAQYVVGETELFSDVWRAYCPVEWQAERGSW